MLLEMAEAQMKGNNSNEFDGFQSKADIQFKKLLHSLQSF